METAGTTSCINKRNGRGRRASGRKCRNARPYYPNISPATHFLSQTWDWHSSWRPEKRGTVKEGFASRVGDCPYFHHFEASGIGRSILFLRLRSGQSDKWTNMTLCIGSGLLFCVKGHSLHSSSYKRGTVPNVSVDSWVTQPNASTIESSVHERGKTNLTILFPPSSFLWPFVGGSV